MEKYIFIASLKDKLAKNNVSQAAIDKHVKIFEDCFVGKTASEIDAVINGAGGLEGIVNNVVNLEKAKAGNITETPEKIENKEIVTENTSDSSEAVETKPEQEATVEETVETTDNTPEEVQESVEEPVQTQTDLNIINEHIKESEEFTTELEKTTVSPVVDNNATADEFAHDISEYDFEQLFAEKLTAPERWIKTLKGKMNEKTYKNTLPIAYIAAGLLFALVSLLFPLLFASAAFVIVAYFSILIGGICFSLVPMGYGIFMSITGQSIIGSYETGLGILVFGVTMLVSILLYNYYKRLVPFLFKQLKKLFALCVRLTKRYFAKTVKEEE